MAMLDKGLKQRIVGALVLLALAVVFLPMLFSREDERRHVRVDVPAMPQSPGLPKIEMQPVDVPEPVPVPEDPLPPTEPIPGTVAEAPAADPVPPAEPIAPVAQPTPTPVPTPVANPASVAQTPAPPKPTPTPTPAPTAPSAPEPAANTQADSRLDENGLPISWSVQLASLSNRASAEALQKKLRSQGYNAYIRSLEGMNRVFVGPVIERAEANRLRDQLSKQQNLNGFLVRFQPERG
ncbi:SPOR domain-containing protein [Pseudomonas mangiferae]|uniref:SPOR domain-containing protein n=1 Tax=Pseudomonas mangiferae TaxID=2593654 RepID=A0A553H1V0_9PSED|nr:SPOR domain-containing protein [Pseudomonas mangiferae]TRX75713.1 SPOR domain-containing protein [Pseudomonas mangiferae]